MIKLNAAEVRVLKLWSCKAPFALREAERRSKSAVTQIGLTIPSGNYPSKMVWAFNSLGERGLYCPLAADI